MTVMATTKKSTKKASASKTRQSNAKKKASATYDWGLLAVVVSLLVVGLGESTHRDFLEAVGGAHEDGATTDVWGWESDERRGPIPEAPVTFSVVGLMNDSFQAQYGDAGIRQSLIWVQSVCLLLAGACYLLVARTLDRDMEGAES